MLIKVEPSGGIEAKWTCCSGRIEICFFQDMMHKTLALKDTETGQSLEWNLGVCRAEDQRVNEIVNSVSIWCEGNLDQGKEPLDRIPSPLNSGVAWDDTFFLLQIYLDAVPIEDVNCRAILFTRSKDDWNARTKLFIGGQNEMLQTLGCKQLTAVPVDDSHVAWFDREGDPERSSTKFSFHPDPIFGSILFTGYNWTYKAILDCRLSVIQIEGLIERQSPIKT